MASTAYTADALEVREWLAVDETATTMLQRVRQRGLPTIMPMPPLQRVALHGRNVLEIGGPSGSGKSELLLQSAVTCILPREWEGLLLGGSERPVVYLDLDGRLDMRRLVHLLEGRIRGAKCYPTFDATPESPAAGGFGNAKTSSTQQNLVNEESRAAAAGVAAMDVCKDQGKSDSIKGLLKECLKRFYLKRCYNSFEFLAALKTMQSHFQEVATVHGNAVELLIVDSVTASYWEDRLTRTALDHAGRRTLSLQTVFGAVVSELRWLIREYPKLLIMATKTHIFKNRDKAFSSRRGHDEESVSHLYRPGFKLPPVDTVKSGRNNESPKSSTNPEFLPASWREFVSHRIILQGPYPSDVAHPGRSLHGSECFFTAEWEKPSSTNVDIFIIESEGIKLAKWRPIRKCGVQVEVPPFSFAGQRNPWQLLS